MTYEHNSPKHPRGRIVRLLVAVRAVSGKTYPVGTEVRVAGSGSSVDGFVDGDWLPLSWWEYAELPAEA
jgi:hypothetical protein